VRAAANTRRGLAVTLVHAMTVSPSQSPSGALEASDAELVARARDEDASAFDALVRRHYGAAFAVALAVMANRADAEDVCHDGFVRAFAHLEDCREPDRFAQWLCTIVRNHARNELVRPSATRMTDLTVAHDGALSTDESAQRNMEVDDLRETLERALSTLP